MQLGEVTGSFALGSETDTRRRGMPIKPTSFCRQKNECVRTHVAALGERGGALDGGPGAHRPGGPHQGGGRKGPPALIHGQVLGHGGRLDHLPRRINEQCSTEQFALSPYEQNFKICNMQGGVSCPEGVPLSLSPQQG